MLFETGTVLGNLEHFCYHRNSNDGLDISLSGEKSGFTNMPQAKETGAYLAIKKQDCLGPE